MKRYGTIQVDLDGLWTNLRYYGYDCDVAQDMVFTTAVPRFIHLFEKYGVKATFFLIGRDGEIREKADLVKQLAAAGHEIANHTFSHPFGLRKLSYDEKVAEIKRGEEIITKITGKKPVGFKSPGYDVDSEVLQILANESYLYDSSIIPTSAYPLIMKINRWVSGGIKRTHGPRWSWSLASNKPFKPSIKKEWKRGKRKKGDVIKITELPCTTMPFLKIPFHATFALKFGLNYFNLGYNLTKRLNLPLNYEFHAADLSDNIKDERMAHLKGNSLAKRYSICEKIIKKISEDYQVVTSRELVERIGFDGL